MQYFGVFQQSQITPADGLQPPMSSIVSQSINKRKKPLGEMQDRLKRILVGVGCEIDKTMVPFPLRESVAKSEYGDEANKIYQLLGGVKKEFPLNLRKWDLRATGFAIELDEYLHFNRYRLTTLRSTAYNKLPKFPHKDYVRYCKEYEKECLCSGGYGGKWSNSSCQSQFGAAGTPKDLSTNGAPRWKQRAFYDYIKDLTPIILGVSVARISIWDCITVDGKQVTVKDALSSELKGSGSALLRLIKSRI